MTLTEKNLLFKELSTRHPYDVKLQVRLDYGDNSHKEGIYDAEIDAITSYNIEVTYYDTNMGGKARDWTFMYEEVKPYLRPMSSMTKKELYEVQEILGKGVEIHDVFISIVDSSINTFSYLELQAVFDWLNAHHFDYRGLILKGLALEAPKGMYNNNNINSWYFYPDNFSSYEDYVQYLKEKGFALEASEGMYK